MKTKRKTPDIRFRGFSDDWEQRKLEELSNIIGGGTPSTSNSEYWNGDIEWYSPAELDGSNYVYNSERKITRLGLNKSSAKILPVGSVLFTSRAGIGKTAILGKESSTNQGFQSIVPIEGLLDSYFIFSLSDKIKREAEKVASGSTFLEISGKQMRKIKLLIPKDYSEQKKIGILFEVFDNTITLHQRKLQQFKEVKRGMLQKMYCKRKSKLPELRFSDFKEQWISTDLENLTTITTGKLDANAMSEDGKYDFYTSGTKKYKIATAAFKGPAITIAGNGATVGYMHLANGEFNAYQRTYVLREFSANREFLFYELNNILPRKIQEESRTGNIPYIVMDMLTKLSITIPIDIQEQLRIGSLFAKVDRMIELQEREIELLEETKKGFLQKMFV